MAELKINLSTLDYVLKMDPLFCYVNYADIRFYLTGFKFSPYCSIKHKYGVCYLEHFPVTNFFELLVHTILI